MKRLFDIILALFLIPLFFPIFMFIWFLIKLEDEGEVLHWSRRVGTYNEMFLMPKFRSMKRDAPQIATHLLVEPEIYITKTGKFLRKTSLDELPQIWSVLVGDMSLVGPRPALFNQDDLVELRTKKGIHRLRPGVTGWAQVNGRDDLLLPTKVEYDEYYLNNHSIFLDMKIIFMTAYAVFKSKGVSH